MYQFLSWIEDGFCNDTWIYPVGMQGEYKKGFNAKKVPYDTILVLWLQMYWLYISRYVSTVMSHKFWYISILCLFFESQTLSLNARSCWIFGFDVTLNCAGLFVRVELKLKIINAKSPTQVFVFQMMSVFYLISFVKP